jgi:hypothetical protein
VSLGNLSYGGTTSYKLSIRPPDNDRYVRNAPSNPKRVSILILHHMFAPLTSSPQSQTRFAYHGMSTSSVFIIADAGPIRFLQTTRTLLRFRIFLLLTLVYAVCNSQIYLVGLAYRIWSWLREGVCIRRNASSFEDHRSICQLFFVVIQQLSSRYNKWSTKVHPVRNKFAT